MFSMADIFLLHGVCKTVPNYMVLTRLTLFTVLISVLSVQIVWPKAAHCGPTLPQIEVGACCRQRTRRYLWRGSHCTHVPPSSPTLNLLSVKHSVEHVHFSTPREGGLCRPLAVNSFVCGLSWCQSWDQDTQMVEKNAYFAQTIQTAAYLKGNPLFLEMKKQKTKNNI